MNKFKKSIKNSRLLFWNQDELQRSEYKKRQKNILKIILISFLIIAVVAQLLAVINAIKTRDVGENLSFTWSPTVGFVFFSILLILTKMDKIKTAAFLFLLTLFLLIFRASMLAGIDNPETIVIYSLIIIMSGILISPKFSLISTSIICLSLLTLFSLHQNNIIEFSRDWRNDTFGTTDTLVLVSSYMIIALVSWLFSSEIINALKRAKKSEKEALTLARELQKEKDGLETKIEERTKELREIQLRELIKINNLAEFGRLSAGLLHDIKNPLTVISLNLDSLRSGPKSKTLELINRSLLAAKTAETIIKSSQKQLVDEEGKQKFNLVQEIKNTLVLINHRAEHEKVDIVLKGIEKLIINGYPARFSRVVANLLMNAIDSFDGIERKEKKIEISIIKEEKEIVIEIEDNGSGIKEEDKSNLFQPFFSKKENKRRTGLGLYSSKKIMQDCYGGGISFESIYGTGTKFKIIIPMK